MTRRGTSQPVMDQEGLRRVLQEAEIPFIESPSGRLLVEPRPGAASRLTVEYLPQGDVVLEVEVGRTGAEEKVEGEAIELFLRCLCRAHVGVRPVRREKGGESVHILQAAVRFPPSTGELETSIEALLAALDHSRDEVAELAEGTLAGRFLALRSAPPSPVREKE